MRRGAGRGRKVVGDREEGESSNSFSLQVFFVLKNYDNIA